MCAVDSILYNGVTAIDEKTVPVDIYSLKYILLYEKKGGRDCFSVRVIQSREGEDICRAVAYDISDSYAFASEVFEKLWQNGVFPVSLCDAVYNLLP